ncbi:MAG: protein kinase domain-containing protein [Panacagrimonas sp.]
MLPGTIVGGHSIVRLLGVGGMARVYEATELALNRGVALKVVSSRNDHSRDTVPRFNREVLSAAKLNHRCIVPIYQFGHDEQTELL